MKDNLAKRIEAAEKTNGILKAKVIALYNGGEQSTIHRQLDKARKRDEENRRKRELMDIRNQELQNYSRTLEGEVARRTEDAKTILNNVTFGFLTVDKDLRIGPELTRSCQTLFGRENLGGMCFLDLFELNERDLCHYRLGIDQVFEDILPTDTSLGQLPKEFLVRQATLRVEGSAVRSADGQIKSILFSISDCTALLRAQKEAAENRMLVGILKQKEAFLYFANDAKNQLIMARKAAANHDAVMPRRYLHTIKGNAASYGMSDLARLIHEIEEMDTIDAAAVDRVIANLKAFLQEHEAIFGFDFERMDREVFEVSDEQLTHLKKISGDVAGEKGRELRGWASQILQKPASLLIGPIEEFAEKLAFRLGKEIRLDLIGREVLVDCDAMRGTLSGLVHLVRNAIDHGVEHPSQRGPKPHKARVSITLIRRDDCYVLQVADDGRGIDGHKILARAVAKGFVTQEKAALMSEKERLELIFVDGLSSADETTDISGRGIGMSAVLAEVRHSGGTVEVISKLGVGTTFLITVPISDPARVAMSRTA